MLVGVALAGWLVGWGAAPAAVYRWTDEAGRVHFGQVPPSDRPYTVVKVPREGGSGSPAPEEARQGGAHGEAPASPPTAEGVGAQGAAGGAGEASGQGGAGQPPRAPAPPSPEACARLARALDTLISRPPSRVLVRGPGGELRRMSEAEHREQVARLRRRLARCPGR